MGTKRTDGGLPSMDRKECVAELRRLHGELVETQELVEDTGAQICVVVEGRDTAGKRGTIEATHDEGRSTCVPDVCVAAAHAA